MAAGRPWAATRKKREVEVSPLRESVALLATPLSSGAAMAQIFLGTVASETIVGTNEPDHLDNKFGQDTVVETATVGTQKLPAAWPYR
jgi:hypothetical protein